MTRSELLGKLMRCDWQKLKGRNLSALAAQIEARTKGDENAVDAELLELGYDSRRLMHGTVIKRRA